MPHEKKNWLSVWWRALAGEVVATALLMLLGLGSLLPLPEPPEDNPQAKPKPHDLTHPALAFGFAVTALVQAFGAVCGAHMNPAVTFAVALRRQLPLAAAAAYVVAQIVGAVVGFALLMAVTRVEQCTCCTLPDDGVSAAGAALVEAWLTAALVLVAGALAQQHDPARPDHTAPLKLGLTIAALVYAGGKLTGASLNPARSLAPALLTACWRAHWAYWAGPLAGAALAVLAQRYVLLPPPPAAARAPHPAPPEELPLSDKAAEP